MQAMSKFFHDQKGMEFINDIYEFAGHNQYWKTRFTNDVLSCLNKNYRLCGMICNNHRYIENPNECDCPDETFMFPCANCYSYGYCDMQNEDHVKYKHVSFEDIKKWKCHTSLLAYPYIPVDTFTFVFKNREDYNYSRKFEMIRKNLPIELTTKRIEYIKKYGESYNQEIKDIILIYSERVEKIKKYRR
jgi:hypothetical protein